MISSLLGIHGGQDDDGAITVDVAGVGYRVYVSDRDRETLNKRGVDSALPRLFCRTNANENEVTIYGFISMDDRRAFDRLQKVDGVGVSTALRMLSVYDAPRLAACVAGGAVADLCKVPGVGKKTAEKICAQAKL